MIKAHAAQSDWGRTVRLWVGRVEQRPNGEVFWGYDFATQHVHEPVALDEATTPPGAYEIPLDYAEEMYHALDRIFGKRDETPGVVKDVLRKEQARVDLLINTVIAHQR